VRFSTARFRWRPAPKPFVWLLSVSTQAVLKLLRVDNSASRAVTKEEIAASLEEGVDAESDRGARAQMCRTCFVDDRRLTSWYCRAPASDSSIMSTTVLGDRKNRQPPAIPQSGLPGQPGRCGGRDC
jgi:hypothetical protein